MRRFLLAVLVALLPASAAATLLQVRLDLSFFYPPNPCLDNDLRDATLGGVARLFHQPTRAGEPVEVGRWTASNLACAASAGLDLAVDLTDDGALLVDFAGQLTGTTTPFSVFAMADVRAERPTGAPLLEVGMFSGGAFAAGNVQQWPLLAFASPGQQIGTLGVRVVSEPGIGALLVTSLLLLATSVHRRPRVPRLAPAVRPSGM
jgi:hypothetical protein